QHATPQEGALQRPLTVDSSAAKSGCFAHCIQSGNRLAVCSPQHAARKIGLDSAQAFARQDELADRDQRACLGIENSLELAGADAVGAIARKLAMRRNCLSL